MKITLQELADFGVIDKLVIESVDLSLYIARAVVAGEERLIADRHGATLKTRNLLEMKQQLAGLDVAQLVLRQRSAYDEMVGQPQWDCDNALEVGLSPELYPAPRWQH
jgi:hypothetical protein